MAVLLHGTVCSIYEVMSAELCSFVGNITKLAWYFHIKNLGGLFILEDAEDLVSFLFRSYHEMLLCV